MNFGDTRLPDRFWSKVIPEPNSGCWLWLGYAAPLGYGSFRTGQDMSAAHRVSYLTLVGEIPIGLVLDHLCRVRCCVNPVHLEPVTQKENCRRSPLIDGASGRAAAHANKRAMTHCRRGHEYAANNLYNYDDGKKYCRACVLINSKAAYARKKSRLAQLRSGHGTAA